MSIHNAILERVRDEFQAKLIDEIPTDDAARGGAVKIGPYQGNPAPDAGRITISIHENDPDRILKAGVTGQNEDFSDDVDMIEIGGGNGRATMTRRFTIKARCLFVTTREDEDEARRIASIVRSRIERTLKLMSFGGVATDDEYVSRGVMSQDIRGEQTQAGGPPDAFDYLIKVQFSVLTTQTGVTS